MQKGEQLRFAESYNYCANIMGKKWNGERRVTEPR